MGKSNYVHFFFAQKLPGGPVGDEPRLPQDAGALLQETKHRGAKEKKEPAEEEEQAEEE